MKTRRVARRMSRERAKREASGPRINVLDYFDDPVGYARDVLGFEPWDDGSDDSQALFMTSVAHHRKIAGRSGHKTGKSSGAGALALWWYETRIASGRSPRVILTAPTDKQVREVIWAEVRRFWRKARKRIPGKIFTSPSSGARGPNEARILGYVAKNADAFSGPSSGDMLVIVDEAAGIDATIYEAIEGMAAAGATIVFLFNPTQVTGPSYDAFHAQRDLWVLFHFDSEKVALYLHSIGREIRGMASLSWVEERRKAWGEDDPRFQVRVRGNFPTMQAAAVVPLGLTLEAMARPQLDLIGLRRAVRVELGVDVARFGDDDSVIAGRLGGFLPFIRAHRGLDGNALAPHVVAAITELQGARQIDPHLPKPIVRVDGNGVGASLVDALNRHPQRRMFDLMDVNSSRRAVDSDEYVNTRAELGFYFRDWLKKGGALVNDEALREQLNATRYGFDKNRIKIEEKAEIKKRIGRSPDLADACFLAVYDIADGNPAMWVRGL